MSALRTGVTLQKTLKDDSIIATKFMDNPSLNDCLKIFKISSETEGELSNSPYQSLDHIQGRIPVSFPTTTFCNSSVTKRNILKAGKFFIGP